MSHHLDSPQARQDPRLDITDQYVFRGERGTVFVLNVSHSLAGDMRGFHPEARYEFRIDGNGDAVEDLAYRFTFGDADPAGHQEFRLERLTGERAGDPCAAGTVVAEGRTGRAVDGTEGLRIWAGRAGDPFWMELDVLRAVGAAFDHGTTVDLSGWDPASAANRFAGHTVHALVLEVPDGELLPVAGTDRRIGVWALSALATDAGGWRQINRVGLPMIHPLFAHSDEHLAARLNEGHPSQDLSTYGPVAAAKVAGVVRAYGSAVDPDGYARAVTERLFPNVLPYTVGTRAVFGFAGWNGRSLIDNTPDVMFSFASNTPISLGLTQDCVTSRPRPDFPYVPPAA